MTFIPAIANARQQYLPKDNRNEYLIAFFILLMWHLGRTNLGKSWKQKIYHHLLQLSKDFPDPNSLNNRRKFQISTRVPSKNITKYQMKSFDWDPFASIHLIHAYTYFNGDNLGRLDLWYSLHITGIMLQIPLPSARDSAAKEFRSLVMDSSPLNSPLSNLWWN